MRGEDRQKAAMFSYVSPERRVPKDHPLAPDTGHGGCRAEGAVGTI